MQKSTFYNFVVSVIIKVADSFIYYWFESLVSKINNFNF